MKSEQNEWLNRLSFYKDEIGQLNSHLGKVAVSGSENGTMAGVEHFQNQLIRQKEVLDIIRHDIKQHENLIQAIERESAPEPAEGIQSIHSTQREKLDQFEKIFHELRGEFNLFLNQSGI